MNDAPGYRKLAAAAAHCRAYGLHEEAAAIDEAAEIVARFLPAPDYIDRIADTINTAATVRFIRG
jgi:hypothetical protein